MKEHEYKKGKKKEILFVKDAEVAYGWDDYYTVDEFLEIDFKDETCKYELIDGIIFVQQGPKILHEKIALECLLQFGTYLRNKKCTVWTPTTNYRFQRKVEKEHNMPLRTLVMPDVSIVCNTEIIKDDAIYGAPTIAIEVLSKSNARNDLEVKYNLYEEVGVKEYWIIFPEKEIIRIHYLDRNGKYSKLKEFSFTDKIDVKILGNFVFQLEGGKHE